VKNTGRIEVANRRDGQMFGRHVRVRLSIVTPGRLPVNISFGTTASEYNTSRYA